MEFILTFFHICEIYVKASAHFWIQNCKCFFFKSCRIAPLTFGIFPFWKPVKKCSSIKVAVSNSSFSPLVLFLQFKFKKIILSRFPTMSAKMFCSFWQCVLASLLNFWKIKYFSYSLLFLITFLGFLAAFLEFFFKSCRFSTVCLWNLSTVLFAFPVL